MSSVVADASAILAVARREEGMEAVLAARTEAIVSAVNHAEVVSHLLRCDLPLAEIDQFLVEAFPHIVPFDREQADIAGRLHAVTRHKKISYADCACLALAQARNLPVLTGDRKWLELDSPVDIRVFR
jgi:ribonuclease VapC